MTSRIGSCFAALSLAVCACGQAPHEFWEPDPGGAADGGAEQTCAPGESEVCYDGPPATINVGTCQAGTRVCNAEGTGFRACGGAVVPAEERCDTIADEDCDGIVNRGCVYTSCATVPLGAPSGVFLIDLDGAEPAAPVDVYCDTLTEGGGWALLYSSIGSDAGETTGFWDIAYVDRLSTKGRISPDSTMYMGMLYLYGREYRDEVEDLSGKVAQMFTATVEGITLDNMHFVTPTLVAGAPALFESQFAAGWSSPDFDADPHGENCALAYARVTQHYSSCWSYNLGADADRPYEDGGWGPHLHKSAAAALGLIGDGSDYTRVRRISRWTRW